MLTPKNAQAPGKLPPDTRKSHASFAKAVGSYVPKLAAKAFEKYGFHSAEIMTAWPRVVGADIASFTAPERIKWPRGPQPTDDEAARTGVKLGGATLLLRVDPARALDVEYRAAEIVDRINRYFGYRAVATLKIIQAPLAHKIGAQTAKGTTAAQLPSSPAQVPASADPVLKEALEALWTSVAAERARG